MALWDAAVCIKCEGWFQMSLISEANEELCEKEWDVKKSGKEGY